MRPIAPPLATESVFFALSCEACGTPICERQSLMNLALGYEETLLCAPCLAQQEGVALAQLLPRLKAYIYSRDCFKTPWFKVPAHQCPLLLEQRCFCEDEADV